MAFFKKLKKNMFLQILLAVVFGTLFALVFPTAAKELHVVSKAYIQLIKMVVNPILFISIVLGICTHQKTKLTQLAIKTLVYFEVLATITILLAFGVMVALKPGSGFHIPLSSLSEGAGFSNAQHPPSHHPLADFFLSMIPSNLFGTLAGENLIAVLVLSILFAVSIRKMKSHYETVVHFFEVSSQVLFQVIHLISKLAPVAIFASFSALISSMGVQTLQLLAYFLMDFSVCCIALIAVLYLISKFNGLDLFKLIKHIREELLIAAGTSSSESVFPQMMEKLESFGCGKNIVSFVMPASYAFNLCGTALYVAAACIFLQQVFLIPFTLEDYFMLFAFIMIISKGAAGVSGAGFITLSAVLFALPHNLLPAEPSLALIVSIDPLMSLLRTVVNLIGSAQATTLMAKYEKEFHPVKARQRSKAH